VFDYYLVVLAALQFPSIYILDAFAHQMSKIFCKPDMLNILH